MGGEGWPNVGDPIEKGKGAVRIWSRGDKWKIMFVHRFIEG